MSDLAVPNVAIGRLIAGVRGSSLTIWLCATVVVVFLIWSSLASVDEIVRAEGEVISSSRPQIIQNLEGGILAELYVTEGDIVEQGDTLARLRGTSFQSTVDELENQINALSIRQMRLEAEMAGKFTMELLPKQIARSPNIAASEQALLRARQMDYVSRSQGAQKVLDQAEQETNLLEQMLEKKVVALIEVTRSRKILADARIKLDEIVTGTELERAKALSDVLNEKATLKQTLKSAQDQLNRTTLSSPMRGVVNALAVTTIGGVVRPGQEILQIIPLDEELFIEARVTPENIANIRPGQDVTIKLSAYDYTIYGSLKGQVTVISADTFKAERINGTEAEPHYRVRITLNQDDLSKTQSQIDIRPGMQVQAELHTGRKTILNYLLKPLYKSREALRER